MSSSEGTLIVTSAIDSKDPYLAIKNTQQRLFQTYCSLISWITKSHIKNIIFCDNTDTKHSFSQIELLARQYQKNFELFVFKGNHERIIIQGKGYGEGEIMKYIFEHSRLLHEYPSFYKITGRIYVENFNEISHVHRNHDVVFDLTLKEWKKALYKIIANIPCIATYLDTGKGYVRTLFYKCSRQYFVDYLIKRHVEVDDRKALGLGNRYFFPLMKNGYVAFSPQPRILGYSAGTGKLYGDADFTDDIKDMAHRLLAGEKRVH